MNALPTKLWTPDKIKDKMAGEKYLPVHRGVYNYLFNNKYTNGVQRYDKIVGDIRAILDNEKGKGYSVYVTGHRYVPQFRNLISLTHQHDTILTSRNAAFK